MIIDTHSHYDDSVFDLDRDDLLSNLCGNNIELVINASADLKGCEDTIKLCHRYDNVYGMIGIHPDGLKELNDSSIPYLKELIEANAIYNGNKIVAVGEIGLDYHYDDVPKELQIKWFHKQLELAKEVNLPVNIHSREAAKDTYDILKEHSTEELGGIIHCYSYSVDMAREYLNLGYYFGIGGVLTFKNARKLVEVVEYLPLEAIVLETDCPYLSPVPFRGERNDSRNLKQVAEKIAELKSVSYDKVIDITAANAKKVYSIK